MRLDLLAEIARDRRATAERLTQAVVRALRSSGPRQFSIEFTALSDLNVEFLVGKKAS